MDIIVPKLKADVVNLWTKKVPHWSSLDPYSSLEESFSDSNQDNEVPVNMPESSRVYFTTIGEHVLCKRHRNYSSTRAHREQTKYTFYRDMWSDRTDKLKCTRKVTLKEPSESRLTLILLTFFSHFSVTCLTAQKWCWYTLSILCPV